MSASHKMMVTACLLLSVAGCADLKQAGTEIGHATRDTTTAIGHMTRDAAKAIGHATRDTTKAIGHASRDAVNSVKEDLSDGN